MLVGLHTHYQMHLASKFTLFCEILPNLGLFHSNIVKFYENELAHFIKKKKNCIRPPYRKVKPLKSGFIENSNLKIVETPANPTAGGKVYSMTDPHVSGNYIPTFLEIYKFQGPESLMSPGYFQALYISRSWKISGGWGR